MGDGGVEPRLHRSQRDVEDLADLLVRELVKIGKQQNLTEQLRYLHAAETIRPKAALVRTYIANALLTLGRNEEAN